MSRRLLVLLMLFAPWCRAQSTFATPDANRENSATRCQPLRDAAAEPASCRPEQKVPSMAAQAEQLRDPVPARMRSKPVERTAFEIFVEDATGERLKTYGRELFEDVPTTFVPVDRVPVPADYVLGPGDELLIRAWGKIDLDARTTIDRDGQIDLPRVGTLRVAGLAYSQVEGHLHSAIAALFKDFTLEVTLGQLRSIQIYVLGNARRPGAYTVGSMSTLVNALFVAGGPSGTGSMRHVQLIRNNQVVTDFDIYDLVKHGDKSHDQPLLPGDILFIPPLGAQVAIAGSVEQPGIYELSGDSTVGAVIEAANGLTSLADTARVLLERVEDHSHRRVEEFSLSIEERKREMKDGDLLQINPLSPKFENAVTLRGNVAQPGRYVWKEGMRVSDLIASRDFLITRDYWNQQNRPVTGNMGHPFGSKRRDEFGKSGGDQSGNQPTDVSAHPRTGQPGNQTGNRFEDQFADQSSGQPDGRPATQMEDQSADDVGNPRNDMAGASDRSGNAPATMMATVGKNNAEINWEYAVIERLDERDLSTRLIPFRLAEAIDKRDSADNQLLRAGDVVTVFSRADLELPMEKHASFVRVAGEVNAPGVYRVNAGESLRDVVQAAGGLTPHSYLYASLLTRVSTRHAQEEQLRQASEQMQRELVARYANATPTTGQSGADQQAQLSLQQAALARLSAIKPTGRVVLEMKPDAASAADIPDFSLEDGDTFYVPPRFNTVEVEGSVYNANAFRHQPEKRLFAYLNDAGGATREADQKRIFVIHADGTVVSRQSRNGHSHGNFDKLRLLPGDAIVVPEKLKVSTRMNDFLQVTQFMSQTALTAAALSVVH